MADFVKWMLIHHCKYKEIVYQMYTYFDMNAASEVRC